VDAGALARRIVVVTGEEMSIRFGPAAGWCAATTVGLAVALASATAAFGSPPRAAVVAQARVRSVAVYRYPGAKKPWRRFASPVAGHEPRVFLVAQRLRGWERVYLPMRPDGITGWVRDSEVTLALDPYRVVVSLRRHAVLVLRNGKVIKTEKAGIGQSVMPTPHGTYYLVELLKQPDPTGVYGPYAFGLSAFSNVLFHFGGGPGEIGLHGTDDPAALGTSVSHGCIRVSNAAITTLARLLPLGTPVQIEN
jgi:lipoprotein-anchoring transpeptidase ErfK/SrfK